jgi:hypothetical protein
LVNFNRKGTILLALDPPKMMTLCGVVRVVIILGSAIFFFLNNKKLKNLKLLTIRV